MNISNDITNKYHIKIWAQFDVNKSLYILDIEYVISSQESYFQKP